MPGQDADGSIAVHPVTSEDIPGRTLVVGLAPELQQNQPMYVLIDTGGGVDSGSNSLRSLADNDPSFAVPPISFIVSVPSARENAFWIGFGDPQIRLNLITVVLVDRAWIFIFSVMFQRAFNTDAPPLSSTGHVALARRASLDVVALHPEEPLEDLLIPQIGSVSGSS